MSNLIPISTYNLALKPFEPVPAIPDEYPVTIRITLAAVDPDDADGNDEPSTLRLLKKSNSFLDDEYDDEAEEDDEDDEEDELDSEEEEKEEPKHNTRSKDKKEKKEEKKNTEVVDVDEDSEEDSEDDDEVEDDVSEFIVCTLSPKVQFQQTLDLTICPDEEVYFVVTGSYPIHLVGNYIEHPADEDSDSDEEYGEYDDEEYDLTPDEDDVVDEQLYDLDDLEDVSDIENKIEELIEEEAEEAPKKSKKNKRASEEEEQAKPSKKTKKNEDKKSVQFTKDLEQGPTGSTLINKAEEEPKSKKADKSKKQKEAKPEEVKKDKKFPTKTLLGGVVTEDRKVGSGAAAKSGNKVGIRYIGKLKNGKVFDKNTSGKPFVFGLGKGECIKGFDLGVAGMAVGGERRVVIPAKMGYGSQALPGIPANSELTFDIKLVSLK